MIFAPEVFGREIRCDGEIVRIVAKAKAGLFLVGCVLLSPPTEADAQDSLSFPLASDSIPNYLGLGIGAAPDYVGADEYIPGGLPFGRKTWDNRYLVLEGNYLGANLLDHSILRLGPSALYRFGRDDTDDDVVDELDSISDTIELGLFAAAEFVDPTDVKKRLRFSLEVLHDVLGEHEGFVASGAVRAWHPVGQYLEMGVGLATSYGNSDYMSTFFGIDSRDSVRSGLPAFDIDAGFRDVRFTTVLITSVSPQWHIGAGLLYSRLVDDTADSPVVDDRGSVDQFVFGAGLAYSW